MEEEEQVLKKCLTDDITAKLEKWSKKNMKQNKWEECYYGPDPTELKMSQDNNEVNTPKFYSL